MAPDGRRSVVHLTNHCSELIHIYLCSHMRWMAILTQAGGQVGGPGFGAL